MLLVLFRVLRKIFAFEEVISLELNSQEIFNRAIDLQASFSASLVLPSAIGAEWLLGVGIMDLCSEENISPLFRASILFGAFLAFLNSLQIRN